MEGTGIEEARGTNRESSTRNLRSSQACDFHFFGFTKSATQSLRQFCQPFVTHPVTMEMTRCTLCTLICLVEIFLLEVGHSVAMSVNPLFNKHRIELFFKDPKDLKERVRFLHSHGFSSFNLVNKNQKDTMEEWIRSIHEEIPTAHVCAHYSLKYNKAPRKGLDEHQARLQNFFGATQADEILMITGSGKDLSWNTIRALESVRGCDWKVSVAYNPYFPDPEDQKMEDHRLEKKLQSGSVSKVYLQFGTNMDRLKGALDFLNAHPVAVAGSLFLPTKKLLAQQKFRPWNGVFLSPEFLSGPDDAESVIIEMMKLYQKRSVEMLWEAPGIRSDKDLKVVFDLIGKVGTPHYTGKTAINQREAHDHSIASKTKAPVQSAKASSPASKRPKRVPH